MSMSQRLPFVPRALVALMSVVLMLLMGVTLAGAQGSEPVDTGTLDITGGGDGPLDPGETVTLTGTGFAPGGQVEVSILSDPIVLATVLADATGSFKVTVAIPKGLTSGEHVLKATGPSATGGLRVLSTSVEIAASTSTASGATLPTTGADPLPFAALGIGAVVIGGLLTQRHRLAHLSGRKPRSGR
jgi:hypothetical protein